MSLESALHSDEIRGVDEAGIFPLYSEHYGPGVTLTSDQGLISLTQAASCFSPLLMSSTQSMAGLGGTVCNDRHVA